METLSTLKRDLTAARSHLKEQGWCVIPDILDQQRTAEVLQRLWQAAEESKKRGNDTFLPILDPNENNVRFLYLLELDSIFRELIQHSVAIEMVEDVLGDNFLINNFTANMARPGSKSMGLHSDQSLVSPDPWLTINAMIDMVPPRCVLRERATLYILSSNKWERRSEIPKTARSMLRPFEAKAGSIIVMDGRVWHTSELTSPKIKIVLCSLATTRRRI